VGSVHASKDQRYNNADKQRSPASGSVSARSNGGGPTGVEMAGAIAELAKRALAAGSRRWRFWSSFDFSTSSTGE
jgi:NADH dehydrogenase FAD-containing subunit